MRIIYLFAVLAATTLFSCSKEETPVTPTAKTPQEMLMSTTWKKSQYKENGTVTPFFAACEMDDVITFKADGNWVLNGGANVCTSTGTTTDFYVVDADNKTMRWGGWGVGELIFSADKSSFTFKRTGANTFEYIFVKN